MVFEENLLTEMSCLSFLILQKKAKSENQKRGTRRILASDRKREQDCLFHLWCRTLLPPFPMVAVKKTGGKASSPGCDTVDSKGAAAGASEGGAFFLSFFFELSRHRCPRRRRANFVRGRLDMAGADPRHGDLLCWPRFL